MKRKFVLTALAPITPIAVDAAKHFGPAWVSAEAWLAAQSIALLMIVFTGIIDYLEGK